jgi:HlyD family secretion protein
MTPPTASPLPSPADLDAVLIAGPRRARRRRWALGLTIAAALLGAVTVGAVRTLRAPSGAWRTATVTRADLSVVVTAVGSVEARRVADVGSEESGVIREVLVEPNDTVKAGQALATLDPADLRAQDREAHAGVAAASAALDRARLDARAADFELQRALGLQSAGAIATAEVDGLRQRAEQAAADVANAVAQLDAARARLRRSDTTLGKAVLRAPIDGVVLTRDVQPGASVVAAFQAVTLFRIASDLRELRVEVDVDEADVPRVQPGQPATLSVPAWPDRTFAATVERVHRAPDRGAGVVTYQADLAAPNADGALWVGMTATAHLEAERLVGALTVPVAALQFAPAARGGDALPPPGPGEGRVWVPDGDEARPVLVQIGPSDGDRQVLRGGLDEGAVVILGREVAP